MRFFPLLCGVALVVHVSLARANALDHLATPDVGLNKNPHLGTSHILVIPSAVGHPFSATELENMRTFYNPAGGVGTFRHYWQVNSNGLYDPIPTLVEPVIYNDRCPIPTKTLANCTFTLDDISLLASGALKTTFEDVLIRVRDEQAVDFTQFDVNTGTGAGQDGYFDGVIMHTDIYSGIGFPLGAFNSAAVVSTTQGVILTDGGVGDGGTTLTCGTVALAPPDNHEYGHTLGFIDLYGGPEVNDLMMDISSTLAAFSRQQIGWGPVMPVTQSMELDLAPVLQGGSILRFGAAPRYLLVENRGGASHELYDRSHAGIYVYSVDETKLPTGALGFVDILNRSLYLPNQSAPYLDVNVPLGCTMGTLADPGTCALSAANDVRVLQDAAGADVGFTLQRGATQADGTVHLTITVTAAAPDAGPPVTSSSGPPSSSAGTSSSGASNTSSTTNNATSDGDGASARSGCSGCNAASPAPWLVLVVLWWRRARMPRLS